MRRKPICIYVDNSNIYISGQEVARRNNEPASQFRIAFNNFLFLITNGDREFQEMLWAGSGTYELENVFKDIINQGVDLHLIPRSESGENETVDHAIQLAMYRHHRKYRKSPGTIVLCTGDGAGFHEERGFLYDIKGFIEDGWDLVLYSWDIACHRGLKKFAKQNGRYIPLENYYYSISFIENGRPEMPVKLLPNRKNNHRFLRIAINDINRPHHYRSLNNKYFSHIR
jgi:hypothetical protein